MHQPGRPRLPRSRRRASIVALALVAGVLAANPAQAADASLIGRWEPDDVPVCNDPAVDPTNYGECVQFGASVATAGDLIVVGAPLDNVRDGDVTYIDVGSIYVYARAGNSWSREKLSVLDDEPSNDRVGEAVATDGTRIVAGAGASYAGPRAYVFEDAGSGWVPTPLLPEPGDPANDFGSSVAIDGDTIVIGAPGLNYDGGPGSAYVFTWNGSAWDRERLTAPAGLEDGSRFGTSVAVDGDRIVVGHLLDTRYDPYEEVWNGAAHVYTRSGGSWSGPETLVPAVSIDQQQFGAGVAVEGSTVVVGARTTPDGAMLDVGRVYVFEWNGATWTESSFGPSEPDDYARFGHPLAISGGVIAVGVPYGAGRGAALLFEDTGSGWEETALEGSYGPEDGGLDVLGYAIAISDTYVVAGNPERPLIPGYFVDHGSVWVYQRAGTGPPPITCNGLPVSLFVPPGGGRFDGTGGDDVILGTDGADVIYGLGGNDTICGEGGDDLILGGPGDDTLLGGNDNDKLRGAAGDDTLLGGAGSDRLLPETGNDTVNGGAGSDIVDYLAGAGPVTVDLSTGTALYRPPGESWTHTLVLVEKADGTRYDDTLTGDWKRNVLRGKQGEDVISGAGGDDDLIGGTEVDEIHGGAGNDLVKGQAHDDLLWGDDDDDKLVGGNGNDTLRGGAGNDLLIGGLKTHLGTYFNTLDGGEGDDTCRWEPVSVSCEH